MIRRLFDAQTGGLTRIETIRYRDEKLGSLRWWGDIVQAVGDEGASSRPIFKVTWEDEGTPWLVYQVEEMVFNADVSSYIRQTGP